MTYQSMVKDLIGHDKESVKIGNEEYDEQDMKSEKELILHFDDDPFWEDFRHMNIAILQKQIKLKFEEFRETYNADKGNPDLLEAARSIKKFIKIAKSCCFHSALSSLLIELYKELQIEDLMEVEQMLVTGLNHRDKAVEQRKKFLSHFMASHSLSTKSKLRLFMIYIITRGGITENQMSNFVKIGQFSDWDQNVIKNLAMLGVDSSSRQQRHKPSKYKYMADIQSKAIELNKTDYVQARYEPLLSVFLRKLHNAVLSEHDFPWCRDANFVNAGDTMRNGASDRSRIIVFVIGGVCWSEVRMCYVLSKELGRHIYLGSSFITSPTEFITLLGGLTPNSEEPDVDSRNSASVRRAYGVEECTTEKLCISKTDCLKKST